MSVLFWKCPKCDKSDALFCANCGKFEDMCGIKTEDGQSYVMCGCGQKITGLTCGCGTSVYGKFFFEDKIQENDLMSKKDQIYKNIKTNENYSKISFWKHYLVWLGLLLTISIFFLVLMYTDAPKYNDNYALGKLANEAVGGEAFSNGFMVSIFSMFVSFIPAGISYFIHKAICLPRS